MRIVVQGTPGSGLTQNDLRAFAINELEDRFRQVEGVASVNVEGGLDPVVQVALSQNRFEAFGITISEISRSLASKNINLGAGFLIEGLTEYSIVTAGEFSSLAEIANIVVVQTAGADIRLVDIGEISFGFAEERSAVFVNGEPGVYISITKQSGANTISVVDRVYRQLEIVERIFPGYINLEVIQDALGAFFAFILCNKGGILRPFHAIQKKGDFSLFLAFFYHFQHSLSCNLRVLRLFFLPGCYKFIKADG